MAFVTEEDVRGEINLHDFDEIPSDLIGDSIEKAHEDILGGTVLTGESTVTGDIKTAEARLAVSHLFRAYAISKTVLVCDWRTSGLQLNESGRIQNLLRISQEMWEEAWSLLRPYLQTGSPLRIQVT